MAYISNKHKVTPYIISDFETGGLDLQVCGLTEIAMMAIEGNTMKLIGEYEALIKPHKILKDKEWIDARYDAGAQKVTGLTQERLLEEGKDMNEVAKEMEAFFVKANVYNSKTGYKPVL